MADLITRLLLDDKEFNRNLDRSKKQAREFEAGINKLKSGMGAFAGTLGIAVSAGALFQKTIGGSQTTSDAFNNAINAAKGSVNEFFSAISTGDFTSFTLGLDNIYKKSILAQESLDQLWNTINAVGLAQAKASTKQMKGRDMASDDDLDPKERLKGLELWKEGIVDYAEAVKTQIEDTETTVSRIVSTSSLLTPEEITIPIITETILVDAKGKKLRDAIKDKYSEEYKEYTEAVKKAEKESIRTTMQYGTKTTVGKRSRRRVTAVDQTIFRPILNELNEKYKQAIIANTLLEKMTDNELEDVTNKLKSIEQQQLSIYQQNYQYSRGSLRITNQIRNKAKGGAGEGIITPEDIIPTQSLKAIEQKIKEANDQLLLATTTEARRTWDATIRELEAKKLIIEVQYKYSERGKIGNVDTQLNVEEAKLPTIPTFIEGQGSFDKPMSAFENYKRNLDEARLKNEEFTMSAYAMGDALHSIAGATEGSAREWITYGANVLGAVGAAIPAIEALTITQKASATTAAADAGAKAASSVAGIPFAGPVLAVGAIASIVAALASLPKFEFGGIVGGSSFSGDRMLARVNSGEMILNRGQQARLFNMINSGGGGGKVEKVELYARGSTLSTVLEIDRLKKRRI